MKKIFIVTFILILSASLVRTQPVRADAAPPEAPPGSSVAPGSEITQVRMISETVVMNIYQDPENKEKAISKVQATFTMRNMGIDSEQMEVRFPLEFDFMWAGAIYPEINDIKVRVNHRQVPTERKNLGYQPIEPAGFPKIEMPWATFDVTFPPGRDVLLEVMYSVHGYGNYPNQTFKYILETGAGWKDSIGSADIIVTLPYKIDTKNFWVGSMWQRGDKVYPAPSLNGNEVRWHFDNLEPIPNDNLMVSLVAPSVWKKVLAESKTVSQNPNNGQSWGRLADAYKESIRMPKGYYIKGPGSKEIFDLSKEAYEKCIALLPKDAHCHYGYADFLWSHYMFGIYGTPDTQGILARILIEIKITLEIDPNNQQAIRLLKEINSLIPGMARKEGNKFTFFGLTATPPPPTPYIMPTFIRTETPIPSAETTATSIPTQLPQVPTTKNPLCGAALILPVAVIGVWVSRRKRT
jgi:hypothetical protein